MNRRVLGCSFLLFLVGFVVVYQIGYFRALGETLAESSRRYGEATYTWAMAGQVGTIPDTICSPTAKEFLIEAEGKYGLVQSFKIMDVRSGHFGIPVYVKTLVKRRDKDRVEVLVRHTPGPISYVDVPVR